MANIISVLLKRPGEPPRNVNVSNSLEALQRNVDGYIETVTLAKDLVIICNEEGRLHGLPFNCMIRGITFLGTILIAGVDGDEFADLPVSWNDLKKAFPNLWMEDLAAEPEG